MSKRFYKTVSVEPRDDAFVIMLDSHELKTPAKNPMQLPTEALAKLVAAEWEAQAEEINSLAMPVMRLVSTALDRVSEVPHETAAAYADYAMSDLLCYRAAHPEKLVQKQAESWDPLLDWAKTRFDISFHVTSGILPIKQPEENHVRFIAAAGDNLFRLTGLVHLAALLGSAILAIALDEGRISAKKAHELAFLDDLEQMEDWGVDEEAQDRLQKIELEIVTIAGYLSAL